MSFLRENRLIRRFDTVMQSGLTQFTGTGYVWVLSEERRGLPSLPWCNGWLFREISYFRRVSPALPMLQQLTALLLHGAEIYAMRPKASSRGRRRPGLYDTPGCVDLIRVANRPWVDHWTSTAVVAQLLSLVPGSPVGLSPVWIERFEQGQLFRLRWAYRNTDWL